MKNRDDILSMITKSDSFGNYFIGLNKQMVEDINDTIYLNDKNNEMIIDITKKDLIIINNLSIAIQSKYNYTQMEEINKLSYFVAETYVVSKVYEAIISNHPEKSYFNTTNINVTNTISDRKQFLFYPIIKMLNGDEKALDSIYEMNCTMRKLHALLSSNDFRKLHIFGLEYLNSPNFELVKHQINILLSWKHSSIMVNAYSASQELLVVDTLNAGNNLLNDYYVIKYSPSHQHSKKTINILIVFL